MASPEVDSTTDGNIRIIQSFATEADVPTESRSSSDSPDDSDDLAVPEDWHPPYVAGDDSSPSR